MRINFLQISNFLSFAFEPDLSKAAKIDFYNGFNIVIGENGAGKSTVLEIINFLFRHVLFRQFALNLQPFNRRSLSTVDERRQVLTAVPQQDYSIFRLEPNWDTPNQEQRIRVSLQLDESDTDNITTILSNSETLTSVTRDFSTHGIGFTAFTTTRVDFDVIVQRETRQFIIVNGGEDFSFSYLVNFEFFKDLIPLHNIIYPQMKITPFSESFAVISSYRNYHAFQPSISVGSSPGPQQLQQIKMQDYGRSMNSGEVGEPPIFSIVRLRVCPGSKRGVTELTDHQPD